ncbi:MAG: ATP-binding protein [Halobacterium sp.]
MRSRRVFVAGLLVAAVLLSGSVFAGFQVYKETIETEHRADVEQTAEQVRTALDARLAGYQETVELWAEHPEVAAHGTAGQRAALVAFVDETAFSGASVVAANGTMTNIVAGLTAERRRALVGRQFGDRAYVQHALAGETYVSQVVEAASGRDIVTVSAPIVRDGDVVATLNAAFHLSKGSFFERAAADLGPAEGVTVRTASGRVIFSDLPQPNTSLIVQNATLQETGWTVSARESRAVVQPTLRRVTALQFGGVAVVLVGIAVFGWWNYRRNLRQVERLLSGFDALEAGDYGVQVGIGGAEEWDRIGAGFNDMSATVERSVAESRERARHLRVLDRLLRHDLRNELNVVRGRAELLADGDGDAAEHAEHIIERCDALLETAQKERKINAVLSPDATTDRVDVAAVAERAADAVRADYPDADVAVEADAAPVAAAVPQVEAAVRELVENAAAHAACDSPSVDVTVDRTDDHAIVAVADDGPGVPEMERRVLTGVDDIDALNHSQGLGLWLVHWVVERSDGSLDFLDNDGGGTTVTVDLPLADD